MVQQVRELKAERRTNPSILPYTDVLHDRRVEVPRWEATHVSVSANSSCHTRGCSGAGCLRIAFGSENTLSPAGLLVPTPFEPGFDESVH